MITNLYMLNNLIITSLIIIVIVRMIQIDLQNSKN